MKTPFMEKVKQWVCRKMGHKQGHTWWYGINLNATCLRCKCVYIVRKMPATGAQTMPYR